MKTRLGFVSNSSTTSFCIYGTSFSSEDFRAAQEDTSMPNADIWDFVENNSSLSLNVMEDTYYIGEEWCTIGNDETGSQFKARVEAELRKLLPSSLLQDIGTHSEAYYS